MKSQSMTVRHGAHRRARLYRLSQAIILAAGMAGLVSAASAQMRDDTAATDVEPLMRQGGGDQLNAAPMAGTMIARAFHHDVGLNARAYAGGGGIGGLFDRVRLAALNTGTASDAVHPMGAYGSASRNVWLRGMAMDGKLGGDAQTAGSSYRATGLVGGVALGLAPGVTAGVAFTAMSGRVSTSGSADSTRIRTPMLAMFAARADGPLQMSGSLSLGRPNYRSERGVTLAGVSSTATGDRDGTEVGLNLEASYGLRPGFAGLSGELRPFVAVQAQRTRIDGFTESGAGAADLTVSASRLSTSSGTAGLRHAVPINDGRAAVESRIGLLHEFGSRRASIDANFVGALAGAGFTTEGAALQRNALLLGLGIGGEVAKHWNLLADLSFETRGSGQNTTGLALQLRKQW
jgi:outer membrane autotransporter protein